MIEIPPTVNIKVFVLNFTLTRADPLEKIQFKTLPGNFLEYC
jgi:hypothetical protein